MVNVRQYFLNWLISVERKRNTKLRYSSLLSSECFTTLIQLVWKCEVGNIKNKKEADIKKLENEEMYIWQYMRTHWLLFMYQKSYNWVQKYRVILSIFKLFYLRIPNSKVKSWWLMWTDKIKQIGCQISIFSYSLSLYQNWNIISGMCVGSSRYITIYVYISMVI